MMAITERKENYHNNHRYATIGEISVDPFAHLGKDPRGRRFLMGMNEIIFNVKRQTITLVISEAQIFNRR